MAPHASLRPALTQRNAAERKLPQRREASPGRAAQRRGARRSPGAAIGKLSGEPSR